MIVCVIIAVLAALVIPSFMEESQKTKGKSEVAAFFAELQMRQEQYKVDNGTYLAVAQCPASAPAETTVTMDCHVSGQPWQGGTPATNLNVNPPMTDVYCRYTIEAGAGAAGASPPAPFVINKPNGNWYYITASCDLDGDGTTSTYFTSSVNTSLQVDNEGD